ncbi:unnamed protein product [Staurois parvus]|uniref:Uncharacterized protein n=1 Tax=Staurois parvus TaxID=386267 RepID=A0ABN9B9Z9_9NEOB|nr:unnamed protein product [Staurois parvus]
MSTFYLLIRQTEPIALLHMLSLMFFFLGRVHVISTGPIGTLQTEVRGSTSSYSRNNSAYKL